MRRLYLVLAAATAALALAGSAASAQVVVVPTVGREVPISATNLLGRPANNSPLLAVDPTDERFVAAANRVDNPDFACAFHLSGDAGRSWVPAQFMAKLPKGAEKCYGPEVAFDDSGRMYVVFVGLKGQGNRPIGVFLTSSTDRGRSWTTPRRVLGALRFQVRLAVDHDSGRMHLAWLEAGADPPLGGFAPVPNPIMAAYSDDEGRSFSKPVQVSDRSRARVVAPALVLGPGQAVHVGYWDLGEDERDYGGLEGPVWEEPWSLVVASSTDGGRRFGAGRVVNDDVMPPQRVMLIYTMPPASFAADDDGRLYAAWHDARNEDWDVFLATSPNGGRRWGAPRRLNDDKLKNGRHQYLPRLSTAPDGRLDVVFYDRRNAGDNLGNDVYFTYSNDAGKTFARNLRLTSLNFDSRVGARYANPSAQGLFDFGARIALVSDRRGALAAWTDTRNTAALGPPAQDLYATDIRLPPEAVDDAGDGGMGAGPPFAIGAMLVGAGAFFAVARRRRRRRPTAPAAEST